MGAPIQQTVEPHHRASAQKSKLPQGLRGLANVGVLLQGVLHQTVEFALGGDPLGTDQNEFAGGIVDPQRSDRGFEFVGAGFCGAVFRRRVKLLQASLLRGFVFPLGGGEFADGGLGSF